MLVGEATLRQWVVNLGQRDAFERIGHLFCELWQRMFAVGLVSETDQFELPLTQTELADTLGLTSVHVDRTLQRLREAKLITLGKSRLTLLDTRRLADIGGFDGGYLRLDSIPQHVSLRSRLSLVG